MELFLIMKIVELEKQIIAFQTEVDSLDVNSDEYADVWGDLNWTKGELDAYETILNRMHCINC